MQPCGERGALTTYARTPAATIAIMRPLPQPCPATSPRQPRTGALTLTHRSR